MSITSTSTQYATSEKLAARARLQGDGAPEDQLKAFRDAVVAAFGRGGGVLEVTKQAGLFLSRKD